MVDALGVDGTRYVLLREAAFDRDSDVSWDSFLRRYNADLANDWGNLVNRTVTMARRYLGGERPAPRPADVAPLAEGWSETLDRYRAAIEGCRLHDALAEFARARRRRQQDRRRRAALGPGQGRAAGDAAAGERLSGVLGDLIETCRLMALVVAPFMPATAPRGCSRSSAMATHTPRMATAGRRCSTSWSGVPRRPRTGRLGEPMPLFPRLDLEAPTA